ncbi:hypothetical protein QYM18_15315 [Ectopseudomonas chengduensis]|nr:hypothetical protein [Pseudomonas chengduensis]WKC35836.1 hypothetical protein QYM18_15315 [Pseudomonas chengduensis]
MKRIFLLGAVVGLVATLVGCTTDKREPSNLASSPAASSPATPEAVLVAEQQTHKDIAGVKALVVTACSEILDISSLDSPEDLAALVKCTNDQLQVIGKETLSRLEAKSLRDDESGQFMLNQAVAFLQASSETARDRDPTELIKIALEGGSRLLLSNP